MSKKDYRAVYRREMGINWDSEKFEVHHINFDHSDNRIENLILLPKDLHRSFHALLKEALFEWDSTIKNYVVSTFMEAAMNGFFYSNLDWFAKYSKCIKELTIWSFVKREKYMMNGKLIGIDGIWSGK